jgi:SAM-dependent methyltransferase
VISSRLLEIVRCPECRGVLDGEARTLTCRSCRRVFEGQPDYLLLAPEASFEETTKFLSESFHTAGRDATVAPPLLAAGVRLKMLQKFLRIGPSDSVLDLGCGSGKFSVWNLGSGAHLVGIDAGPFFAAEARAAVDLIVGDLRALPLADASMAKAYSLDVFEHLSRDGLLTTLREVNRVLKPGGSLFVYTHVAERTPLQPLIQLIRATAQSFERRGLADLSYDKLRKSDHLNPLQNFDDLRALATTAGFRIAKLTYYTPLFSGLAENLLVPVAAHMWARRRFRTVDSTAVESTRAHAKAAIAGRGLVYRALSALTALAMLDVVLFGRWRAGPFFALLVKHNGERGSQGAQ